MSELKGYLASEAEKWAGVKVYFREDWGCTYFEVAGKCFALYGKNKEKEPVLTIKGLPEKNELLREQYSFVVPGYYTNKTHWNSILVEKSTFSKEEHLNLLKESRNLVVAKLPKKVREGL
ncbi:MmcQ/YjbR family DNA-binding protein [Enterococcus rivorum]|uniref:DNA-binding protein n=1 Tax=Enterococcus rivorum TaxID=762845 RepID=A0A1E5KZN5_9ENTE|nr:MmcQ/YjbR family DNA-binding protein [Enterococcus rivorum]MBP2099294.1 putative DNA-binding protein (MmcQ/YjbR family) [Enterococcus rivorum]OEH83321.1 hypothetical protein BCR26_10355 [Enterococcus rivorum]